MKTFLHAIIIVNDVGITNAIIMVKYTKELIIKPIHISTEVG